MRINAIGAYFDEFLSGFTFGSQTERISVTNNIDLIGSSTTGFTYTFPDKTGVVALLDDINYLTGATFNQTNGVLSLNMLTGNTVNVDLDNRYLLIDDYTPSEANTDDYVTGATFSSEVITFTRLSGATFTVDLSGTYDNYNGWDLLVNGTGTNRITTGENVNFVEDTGIDLTLVGSTVTITNSAPDQIVSLTASGATSISGTYPNFTIGSTNTTYTAGSGIDLNGTEFSHTDTSNQASVDNSGNTFIQDITLDDFGHITGIVSNTVSIPPTNLSQTVTTTSLTVNSSTGSNVTLANASATQTGVITTAAQTIAGTKTFSSTISGSITGNAGTATALQTARTINGTSFNGTSNIVTAFWGTARTITIGNTGKSVNGSTNYSWSLAEIGAQPAGTYDNYVSWNLRTDGVQRKAVTKDGIVNFSGGTNVNITYTTDTVTINASNTTYTAGSGIDLNGTEFSHTDTSSQASVNNSNGFVIQDITLDTFGHITSIGSIDLDTRYDNYNGWDLLVNGAGTNRITTGEDVNFVEDTGIDLTLVGSTVTITNSAPDQIVSLTASGATSISGTYPNFTIGSTDTNTQRSDEDIRDIVGATLVGSGSTTVTVDDANDIITISSTDTNTTYTAGAGIDLFGTTFSHTDTSSQPSVDNSGNAVIQDILLDTFGHITGLTSTTITDITGNAGTATRLQTARLINGTSFNGTTNITTANWGTARNITIGNTTRSVNGSTNYTWTLSDIGAQPAGTYDNYVSWNLQTNGVLRKAVVKDGIVNFVGSTNVSVGYSADTVVISATDTNTQRSDEEIRDIVGATLVGSGATTVTVDDANDIITISSTDTNTTYTAGSGIDLNGTQFSHTDTSSQASVNNGGTTVIQDITLDTFGHITSIGSVNLSGSFDNYNGWDLLVNGTGTNRITTGEDVNFVEDTGIDLTLVGSTVTITNSAPDQIVTLTASGATSISGSYPNFTIGSTNTTYTAGSGIDLNGTQFSHTDTSSQSSVNNGGNTVIQDVLLDTFGHITGLTSTTITSISGNAGTATALQTARNINGTAFDGTSNIVTSFWGSTRTITIGNTGKSVNGSTNVSWSLAEIGAQPAGTYDNYVSWNLQTGGILRKAVTKDGIVNFVGSTNVNVTYSADTVVISATDTNTQRSDEEIRDIVGATLVGSGSTTVTVNDAADIITISSSDTTYTAGSGIDLNGTQFSHTDTSSQASVNNGGTTVIQDITLDTFGHITAIGSVNLSGSFDNYNGWDLLVNGVGTNRITTGEDVNFVEDTGIDLTLVGSTVTITNSAPDQIVTLTASGATSISGSYPNFTIGSANTTYTAGNGIDLNGTQFSHTDTSTQTSVNNSGNAVIQDILLDTFGHITGLTSTTITDITGNAGTATRLQTARLINGTSFDGTANITTATWGTARTITIGNTGKSVNGGSNVSWSLAEIGAQPAGTYDNYVSWNLQTNGVLRKAVTKDGIVNFVGSTNVSVGYSADTVVISATDTNTQRSDEEIRDVIGLALVGSGATTVIVNDAADTITISSTDTNTTYTAGNGIDLNGTQFSHTDTSNQASVDNSGNTFIQDITLDGFGHITGIVSNTVSIPPTNLSQTVTTTSLTVNSSTGSGVTLANASPTQTGVITTTAQTIAGTKTFSSTISGSITGNAGTATALQTARLINGTSFNGTANITTANWGTARTITIGNTGKSVNGSTNYSWSLAEIGAQPAGTYDNYVSWNLRTNGVQRKAVTKDGIVNFSGGTNVSVVYTTDTVTINATDTTYTAGSGIDLVGTEFSHTDTSSQGSVNNSNGFVIQDITLDTFGHVTAIGSIDLDGRYDNYNGWDLLVNGAGTNRITTGEDVNFVEDTGISLTLNGSTVTVTNTAPDQIVSLTGNDAISVTGSYPNFTISHSDTSSQTSVDNSGNAVIQDILLDTFGHITGLTSTTITNISGNAGTATALQTARNINGTAFDGTSNIVTSFWGTARNITIGNTTRSVNGSTNYTWTLSDIGAQSAGNYVTLDTTQTITAQKTFTSGSTPIRLNGTSTGAGNVIFIPFYESNGTTRQGYIGFGSSGNSTLYISNDVAGTRIDLQQQGGVNALTYVSSAGTGIIWHSLNDGANSGLDADLLDGLQATDFATAAQGALADNSVQLTGDQTISGVKTFNSTIIGNISGNAGTATALQTARNINGTAFNGTSDITTSFWGSTRTITIGNTGKSVNGSTNYTWTLAEIGAQSAGNYVTIDTVQTITAQKTFADIIQFNTSTTQDLVASTATTDHFKKYENIAVYSNSTSSVSGKLRIEIPVTTSNMWSMEVVIVEYDGSDTSNIKTTKLRLTAYSTNNVNRSVLCDNPDRITSVEFGRNLANDRTVILITPNSTFRYPKAQISEIYTHFTYRSAFADPANYAMTITTDETDFTLNGTILNNAFLRDSFYRNASNLNAGTVPSARLSGTYSISISGNAGTATALQTARLINGTSFNGTANITTANWGTARTITIGNTGKSVNGSTNYSWSLAEIGAQPAGTYDNYVSWNLRTNGVQRKAVTKDGIVNFSGGTGIAISYTTDTVGITNTAPDQIVTLSSSGATTVTGSYPNFTISSNDTDTTYTAGAGIDLNGIEFSHADTSSQGSVNNSGNTVIQDILLDTFGHITGLTSTTITSISGNAGTATTLQTARNINGTAFNGGADIVTSYWGTTRTLTIGNTGKSVNGSANVSWSLAEIGLGNYVTLDTTQTITGAKTFSTIISGSINGNAATATALQTARLINGTSFNGTANITTANWGTARNITIGNTTRSVNGSGNYTWTLSDIGAQSAGNYVTLDTVQTITANKTFNSTIEFQGRVAIGNPAFGPSRLGDSQFQAPVIDTQTINFKNNDTTTALAWFYTALAGNVGYVTSYKNFSSNINVLSISSINADPTNATREVESTLGLRNDYTDGSYTVFDVFNQDYASSSTVLAQKMGFVNIFGGGSTNKPTGFYINDVASSNISIVWEYGLDGVYRFESAPVHFLNTAKVITSAGETKNPFSIINEVTTSNEYVDLKLIAGNTADGVLGTILRHQRDGTGGGDFQILTNSSISATSLPRMTVKSGGNVGIDITNPTERLHVVGNGLFTGSVTASSFNGNATSATQLQTARNINGTPFDGTSNIVTAFWGTARNITIGNTTRSVNGSTNYSWSLAEIGADNYNGWDLIVAGITNRITTGEDVTFVGAGGTAVSVTNVTNPTVTVSSTTYNVFTDTTNGLVPAPQSGTSTRYLREDGTWQQSTSPYWENTSGTVISIRPAYDKVAVVKNSFGIEISGGISSLFRAFRNQNELNLFLGNHQISQYHEWRSTNPYGHALSSTGEVKLIAGRTASTWTGGVILRVPLAKADGEYTIATIEDLATVSASTFTRTVNGLVPAPGGSTTTRYLREDGSWTVPATDLSQTVTTTSLTVNSSTGNNVTLANASPTETGVITTSTQTIAGTKTFSSTISGSITGNAGTANALFTGRNINGTSFNGTTNITTAIWGTARNITIGNTTRSVNGSTNYSWSLADIGAQSAGNYVTIDTVQTITAQKTFADITQFNSSTTQQLVASTSTTSHFRKYENVAVYSNSTSTVSGKLRIEIPVTTSIMWSMEVVLVEYDGSNTSNIKTTRLRLTSYTTSNGNRSVLCDNPDRITSVEFGRNVAGNRTVILITPNSTFRYPKAQISEIYTHHTYSSLFADPSNYAMTITTDETDFNLNGTILNNAFLRDSFYLDASNLNAGTVPSARLSGTYNINISGNANTASQVINTVTGTNSVELVRGNMADNDQFRILVGATASNAGYAEIATADDSTEPIYVRQYSGQFTTLTRTATLLDGSGNTQFPGSVTASSFIGNGSQVTNVNADLLDGYNSSISNVGNTVAVRDSSGDINARLFRSEYDTTNGTINFIMTQIDTASNNYIRPSTPAQLISALNLATTTNLNDYVTLATAQNITGLKSFYAESSSTNARAMRWLYPSSPSAYYLDFRQVVTSGNVRWSWRQVNNNTDYGDVLTLNAGKVGVNTIDPTEVLDVNGTAKANSVHAGGQITSSTASLQVNGFQRTGNIYLHSGGNSPNTTRANDWLENTTSGDLRWNKSGSGVYKIWHEGNFTPNSGGDFTGEIETPRRKIFSVVDEGSFAGAKWYRIATVNRGNSGLTIKGTLNNHVEGFGTQEFELAFFGRADTANDISIVGRFEVSSSNVGVRVIKTSRTTGSYAEHDIYIKTTQYSQVEVEATIQGNIGTVIWYDNPTPETLLPSGVVAVFDNTTYGRGSYTVSNKTIYKTCRLGIRNDNDYLWIRRSIGSGAAPLFLTNQGSGEIARFYSGAGDGTLRSYIANGGQMYAPDFVLTSDERLKENITIASPEKIDSTYKRYNLIDDDTNQIRFGVVAQELEKSHPEFVRTDEDGYKSVSYTDLHSAEINYLKNKVEEQEDRISKLESLVEKLLNKE